MYAAVTQDLCAHTVGAQIHAATLGRLGRAGGAFKLGQQLFAGEATRLAYMTDEAQEGRSSFLEKRDPDWSPFPWHF